MRLIIFHYHFLPGGVTQVVKSSAVSIFRYLGQEIEGITIVSGRKENLSKLLSDIKATLEDEISGSVDIKAEVIQDMDYISGMDNYPDPDNLAEILIKKFRNDLWWIHNYHIGKNPFFTDALLRITDFYPDQKMVFHIHDFPEEARYNNLQLIKENISKPLYPVSDNVRYVTINLRDKLYLEKAGIPDSRVFLLNNPVESLSKNSRYNTSPNSIKLIEQELIKTSPGYIRGAPLMVYPVRTIRRKNILEAGLLARSVSTPVNLLVTLPGISKSESNYSELIDNCFARKLIPGSSRAGVKLEKKQISFLQIIESSNLIISTSVQEGFGYLFINSLQWEKPLLARSIETSASFTSIFGKNEHYFYNKIEIPLDKKLKEPLLKEYKNKLGQIKNNFDTLTFDRLTNDIELMLKKETLDFSFLSPLLQQNFLENLRDPGLLKSVQLLNSGVIENMENLLALKNIKFDNKNIGMFSLKTHAEQIKTIIGSFHSPETAEVRNPENIENKLLSLYADISSLRLLNNPF